VKQHEVMGTREGAPSLFLASLKLREKSDLASCFAKRFFKGGFIISNA
jgi:hypothetical protein